MFQREKEEKDKEQWGKEWPITTVNEKGSRNTSCITHAAQSVSLPIRISGKDGGIELDIIF